MTTLLMALGPTFILILLGWWLRRSEFPGPSFWPVSERLTYYVLFPGLLVDSLAGAPLDRFPVGATAACLAAAVLASTLLLVLARPWLGLGGPAFTSVFQGSIRPNTYVGLALASALLGKEGLALAAVALMVLVPLVNVLSVLALSAWGEGNGKGGAGRVFVELAKNPLIWSCAVGVAWNLAGLELPLARQMLKILGQASLSMGLLAVGAGLRFEAILGDCRGVAAGSAFKLVLLPVLVATGCSLLGIVGPARSIAVIFSAIPVSASSFILARQMGGDHHLMASIITAETVFSAATMPLAVAFLA